ncbi:GNAT family N-acetyltransferase [Embleya scabrispora]|uniref:GNAT family N-acetyltransferase n=1 Tax=Embleya scabrispora TaxID=159449 RepID=UPI0003711ADD|nr:GNAT family N-acetyltransferase [Embleya scabrispora]MYS87550.1 GNAT family N-acetyltransferase [Streptomyces sp. SID5474]
MGDLETTRLVLHPLTVAETERVVIGTPADDAHWAPGYPTPGDVVGGRRFLETCASSGDPGPFGNYEIRRRADGRAIGGLGFHGAPDASGTVTIGYGLIPAARGHGYATEALRELLRFAREAGAIRVQGDTAHDNVASQHVMTAVGMRLTKEDAGLKHYAINWAETETETDVQTVPEAESDPEAHSDMAADAAAEA